MNYAEWNSRIGEYFFGPDSEGKRVVMCVTRDTLEEVSTLPPEEALSDFVTAVLEGPDWNRIIGCTKIETKVHCCLHVDPQWGQHWVDNCPYRRPVAELDDLSSHMHWTSYKLTSPESGPDRYPPYLGYLAAFVLAWTERDPGYNGNSYYDPLLDLLDPQRQRWQAKPAFGYPYKFQNQKFTMNDVWKDLAQFCQEFGRAELILPDAVLRPGHYVDTPKFFGLMKASDLRNLDRLFAAMEGANTIKPDFVPLSRAFVGRVLAFGQAADHLSATCLNNLQSAATSGDASLAEAYGRLLQSKYRDFDGLPDEEDQAQVGQPQRTARLLRVMDRNGAIKVVCRLRSEAALKKLSLEEDADYVFTKDGIEISAGWISGSEWFRPMDFPIINPLDGLELECPALRIKAVMSAKDFLVLHNPVHYFLAGCKVELDEVEKGRQYVLLAKGDTAPVLDGIRFVIMNIPCPLGLTCWSFSVPANATSEGWPECLPPLLEEKTPRPKLSFSGFRLEPRTTRFPVGLPIHIRCSVDNVGLQAIGIDGCDLQEGDGVWVLIAPEAGTITLSLRGNEDNQAPEGWDDQNISIESLHQEGASDRAFPIKLMGDADSPPYPEALVELIGGVIDPRCAGDHNRKTYFATAAPCVQVKARNLHGEGDLKVLLGGKQCAIAQGGSCELPPAEPDQCMRLEVKVGEKLLTSRLLAFSREPEIQVKCASRSQSQPLEVSHTLVATVRGDQGLIFDWEVRSGETRMTGGQALISDSGTWEGVLLAKDNAGLESGKTYEVRFGFGGNFRESQWFKFRNVRSSSGGVANATAQRYSSGGFSSLENAFKGILISGNKGGGRP